MTAYVTLYMPDQPGIWLSTDCIQSLNAKYMPRYTVALDEGALQHCKAARLNSRFQEEEVRFISGDTIYVISNYSDDDEDEEVPLYKLFYYRGTPDEFYDSMSEDRQRREQLEEESRQRELQREASRREKDMIRKMANNMDD